MKPERPPIVQESDSLAGRRIARVTIASFAVFSVSLLVAALLLGAYTRSLGRPPPQHSSRVAPRQIGPIDQSLIGQGDYGLSIRRQQQRTLDHYGWVDRDAGIARIPIDRAMHIVAQRGGAP
jgi:hypothetical protein